MKVAYFNIFIYKRGCCAFFSLSYLIHSSWAPANFKAMFQNATQRLSLESIFRNIHRQSMNVFKSCFPNTNARCVVFLNGLTSIYSTATKFRCIFVAMSRVGYLTSHLSSLCVRLFVVFWIINYVLLGFAPNLFRKCEEPMLVQFA